MNNTLDIAKIRLALEKERRSLLAQAQPLENFSKESLAAPDLEDLARKYDTQQRQSYLDVLTEDKLAQIESALERIAQDMYGKCLNCDTEIPAGRLMALPYAELCVTCQEKKEKVYP